MKDLNKVDNKKLKSIAKIVNISASGEGVS
jgi:hypothetical protein